MFAKILPLCSVVLLCILTTTQKASAQQSKQKLIITSILDEPYLRRGDDGDGSNFEGFIDDLAEEIADELDSEYEIRLVKDGRYGSPDPSSPGGWNGMVGEVIRQEAHLAIAPLTITANRAKVVDLSQPFQEFQSSILMQKAPEEEDESDASFTFLEPLHGFLWLSIILSLCGLLIISLVIEWSFKSVDNRPSGFINFLRQDAICKPESVTGKLLRLVFWIFVLIIVGAYTASFTAQRLADSEEHITSEIDSIEDVAEESDELQYGIIGGGSTAAYFKNSDVALYKQMYDVMLDKDNLVSNYTDGIERVREGNFAFLIESPKAEYYNGQSPCDTVTVGEDFGPSKGYAVATSKGSPLSERVNLAILEMKENGKLEQMLEKWWNDGECSGVDDDEDDGEDEDDFDQLHLSELAGVFYFLFGGLLIVLIVWFLESRAITKTSAN